jgi:elongation of very long chain fatty acids protein 7
MYSPIPSAIICIAYTVFVIFGKSIMKDRKPFELKNVLIIYNFAMVIVSGYLFYEVILVFERKINYNKNKNLIYQYDQTFRLYYRKFLMSGWLFDYSFSCQPVDYSNSPKALRVSILLVIASLLFFFV